MGRKWNVFDVSQSAFQVKLDKRYQSKKNVVFIYNRLWKSLSQFKTSHDYIQYCKLYLFSDRKTTFNFNISFHMTSSEYRDGIILQGTRGEEYSVFRKSFELERDVDWTPPASSLSPPDWLKTSPFLASVSHSLSRTICHQVFWSLPSQHSHLCQSLYSYSVLNVLFRHLGLTSDEQGGGVSNSETYSIL